MKKIFIKIKKFFKKSIILIVGILGITAGIAISILKLFTKQQIQEAIAQSNEAISNAEQQQQDAISVVEENEEAIRVIQHNIEDRQEKIKKYTRKKE